MSGSSRRGIGAVDLLLDGFAGYLRSERGVTELTVDVYVGDIRRFPRRSRGRRPQRADGG